MPTWPAALCKRPPEGAWENEPIDPVVRNQPEIGPPMARKRATTYFDLWNATFIWSTADYKLALSFWEIDCEHGSLTFDGPSWVTPADTVTYRFMAPPKIAHRGVDYLNVVISLVRMP